VNKNFKSNLGVKAENGENTMKINGRIPQFNSKKNEKIIVNKINRQQKQNER
jgi:hypothetical protein